MTQTTQRSSLRLLTLNIWGGALHCGAPLGETIEALRSAGADVIALQEAWRIEEEADPAASLAGDIAEALGLHHHVQTGAILHGVSAVLSRHPILGPTASGLGVRLDLGGREVMLFNLHLPATPYQPYQLLRIDYDGAPWLDTAVEAEAAAAAARGHVIDLLEHELQGLDDSPVIVAGDFNEPSHLDWTPRAAAAGLCPLAVDWPATRRLADLGFADLYRSAHPDEIARPGRTWTTFASPGERHDRIDFLLARGPGLEVLAAEVLGEGQPAADRAVTPWPSDHRAVLAEVGFAAAPPPVALLRRPAV